MARDRDSGGLLRPACEGSSVSQRAAWSLTGVLFVLVAITLPELGSDPLHFRPPSVDPQGLLAPLVRAAGEEWDVGIARAAAFAAALLCGGFAAYLLARRPRDAPALDRHCARAGGRAAALRSLHAPPARPARRHRAVVLHERLDLPGGVGRRPGAPPRQPLRARLPRLGAGALLYARRQRVRARARSRGRARALRLLPRRGAHRGGLAVAARAIRRLPAARPARHAGAAAGRAAVPRPARVAARAGGGPRVQPDRGALGLVRPERRAQPAAPGAGLRTRHAPALRAGPRRRSPARYC